MKELSNLIKYNWLRACKVKTHGANAIRPMEDACREEGGNSPTQTQQAEGSNAKDKDALKAILRKVAFTG